MEKKIFISHSSLDTEIGEKFVDALIEIGIPKDIIFYSSRYHTGVEIGNDFHAVIKNHLLSCDIVVFLLTKNFYNSPACLNEMGAAWILNKNISPILLGNLKPTDMRGFIDSHYIAFTPKPGEEYKLLSKLNPYITTRNTSKTLQEIFNDFITEANKITAYSEQYTETSNQGLSFLEEMIINRRFTDGEILVLDYFKQAQSNTFVSGTNTNFDKYVHEYGNFNYKTAINLLETDNYIYLSENFIENGSERFSYQIDMEYFRQLLSIGNSAEKYIESIKSKYKRVDIGISKETIENSNVLDKYLEDNNTREIEVLFIAYAYDKVITSFGDRWMASNTISNIQAWERETDVNNKLSQNYYTALNLLISRGILEVASCTSYGNPREYKFKDEYAQALNSINKYSKELINTTKENNYQLYIKESPLPF